VLVVLVLVCVAAQLLVLVPLVLLMRALVVLL